MGSFWMKKLMKTSFKNRAVNESGDNRQIMLTRQREGWRKGITL